MIIPNEEQDFFDYLKSLTNKKEEAESEAKELQSDIQEEEWDYEVKEDVESASCEVVGTCHAPTLEKEQHGDAPTIDRGEEKGNDIVENGGLSVSTEDSRRAVGGNLSKEPSDSPLSSNWRDGFLVKEHPLSSMFIFGENSQHAQVKEIVALGFRLDNEICEFQAELINGKIYAGRNPIKEMV